MLADTDTPDIVEYDHVDPEQVAESEQVAPQAETDANLLRRLPCRSFKQHIEEEDFEHQAEIEAEIRVEDEKAVELESKEGTVKKSLAEQQHRTDGGTVPSCRRSNNVQGKADPDVRERQPDAVRHRAGAVA